MDRLKKISRNSPCPCGSGKKYKKCCLRQNELISSKIIKTSDDQRISDFAYIEPNAMKIFDKIKMYKFEDLIRAVFCLNLWRRNRSALAQGLTLHKAISTKEPFGEQPIDSYDEFQQFYVNIIDLLPITPMEDFIIDDYGEVFISHEGEAFPIIIGNGYNQGYATVRYLQTLAGITDNGHNLREILSYIRHIIAFTKETNTPNEGYTISYELPSEDFWETIKELFENESFKNQCSSVANIFNDCITPPIESLHFIQRPEGIYPVYNSGILVDYYHELLSEANDKHKHEHILKTIYDLLDGSFNLSPEPPNRVLISPIVLNTNINEKIIPNKLCFATATKEYVVIGIDRGQFDNDSDVKKCIDKINNNVKSQGVCLMEPFMRDQEKGSCGIKLDSSANILYMLIDTFTDAATHVNWVETETNKWMNCTALDLIYLLGFSKDWDEIVQYMLHENADKTQVLSNGGKSNHFFTWKNSNRLISDGAFEADFLNVDFNETEFSTYWFFKESIPEFPKTGKGLYRDPLNWTTREGVLGYSSISHKGCHGFAGVTKELCLGTYVFLAHNVEFFSEDDFNINGHTAINTIDELNQRLFLRYDKIIGEFDVVNGKTLQILYMPWSYAIKNHPTEFIADSNRQTVYSDECVYEDSVIIRYSVDCERLLKELKEAKDRTAENAYFRELVLPLAKHDPEKFNMLDEQLCFDNKFKKTVAVFELEQHYYFSHRSIDTEMSTISLTRVRKEIAKACKVSGILPGKYAGSDATNVIRKMQKTIVQVFENTISKYDKFKLHSKALNYYAIQQNGIVINAKRYLAFKDLDEDIQREFEENTRVQREECRKNSETIKYLIESNLAIDHTDSLPCEADDFNYLLSFADWLVVLQDDSDMCHHKDPNFTILVDEDYKVNPFISEELQNQQKDMLLRKYNTIDYYIKSDETDIEFIKKAADAFEQDTGINFGLLITLIEYMQLAIVDDNVAKEVYTNVFEVSKDVLKKSFQDALENDEYDQESISKAIDFLILDTNAIKQINGESQDFLPVWERVKRDNKFSVKPVITNNDMCIFSPVIMNNVLTLWKSGITEWYLPYEIGFQELSKILKQWKKRYEYEMVQDIAKLFKKDNGYKTYPEVDLFKRFPKEGYPQELGDYDVLAINESKREIWLIESKVIQKVGSIYESQMQQKDFFVQKKYDEKFQRRIDFITENTSKILSSFGVADGEYRIIPYMVTNKLFESRYKKISFPIISFSEIAALLKANS